MFTWGVLPNVNPQREGFCVAVEYRLKIITSLALVSCSGCNTGTKMRADCTTAKEAPPANSQHLMPFVYASAGNPNTATAEKKEAARETDAGKKLRLLSPKKYSPMDLWCLPEKA